MLVVGTLSGTSVDGIDVCVSKIEEVENQIKIKLICYNTVKWKENDKETIFKLMNSNTLSAKDFCKGNFMIGKRFSEAILETLEKFSIKKEEISLIGSHGQTVN